MTPDDLQQAILQAVYGPPPPDNDWQPWTWLGPRKPDTTQPAPWYPGDDHT